MDFDESRLYFSHQQLQTRSDDAGQEEQQTNVNQEESDVDIKAVRRHFREFLRKYFEFISPFLKVFLTTLLLPIIYR